MHQKLSDLYWNLPKRYRILPHFKLKRASIYMAPQYLMQAWNKGREWSRCGKIERMSPRSQHTIQVLCFGDMGGGDCTWKGIRSHGRHLSFKRLIRECACRCPVFMMDEYGTSLTCPGCGSEMVTTDKINRLRTCTKFLREGKSCLASISSDRDERSAAQMVLGALCHMIHGKRPKHLARKNSSSNEEDHTSNSGCCIC